MRFIELCFTKNVLNTKNSLQLTKSFFHNIFFWSNHMLYNHRIIFLSLSIFFISLAAKNPTVTIKPLDEPDIPEIIHNILKNQQHHHHHHHHHEHHHHPRQQTAQTIAQTLVFSEIEIEEIQRALRYSPEEARFIVKFLQNPELFALTQDYRSATFVGEPGTGKTTTAKGIALRDE
jgi:hypothetical protein